MRGRAGYIHKYAKDLGMNDDEAVYPSFYLRQLALIVDHGSRLGDIPPLQAYGKPGWLAIEGANGAIARAIREVALTVRMRCTP